jgi:hypothetical protein
MNCVGLILKGFFVFFLWSGGLWAGHLSMESGFERGFSPNCPLEIQNYIRAEASSLSPRRLMRFSTMASYCVARQEVIKWEQRAACFDASFWRIFQSIMPAIIVGNVVDYLGISSAEGKRLHWSWMGIEAMLWLGKKGSEVKSFHCEKKLRELYRRLETSAGGENEMCGILERAFTENPSLRYDPHFFEKAMGDLLRCPRGLLVE